MNKVINFLRSETFVFLTLACVLFVQIVHTLYLFNTVRVFDLSFTVGNVTYTGLNWLNALFFAIAVEVAVLMFIINGKSIPAKIYTATSFFASILYYEPWSLSIPKMATSGLISALLACSIWLFSDLFAEKAKQGDKKRAEKEAEDKILEALLSNTNGKKITHINGKMSFKTTMPESRLK